MAKRTSIKLKAAIVIIKAKNVPPIVAIFNLISACLAAIAFSFPALILKNVFRASTLSDSSNFINR